MTPAAGRRRWARAWTGPVLALALVAALAVLPSVVARGDDYVVQVLTRALVLGVLALGAEVAWGFTGIFTLGQAFFFGLGAYACGLLSTRADVVALPALLAAGLAVGAAAGALLGIFLFTGRRVSELYVGLSTLALAYAAERLANGWATVGAANGIPGVPLPTLGGTELEPGLPLYAVALTVFGVVLLLVVTLVRSQFGLVMRAVRDDEERAEFLGYRRGLVQVLVFALSGGLAGLAGALYALSEGFVSPTLLGVALSTSVLLWVVLGGRGTVYGPLLGVALLEVAGRRAQDSLPQTWPIVVGALLLLTILFLPGGVWSVADVVRGRRRPRPAGPSEPEPADPADPADPTDPAEASRARA